MDKLFDWLDNQPEWVYVLAVFSIPVFVSWVLLGGLQ